MIWITIAATVVAAKILALFLVNLVMFRRSPHVQPTTSIPKVSVLIPARNEAKRIQSRLQAILASEGVDLEVCVLDDQSTDQTAEIVNHLAAGNPALRLISGSPVPSGWNGKQFACHQLAELASYDELVFLDADVSVTKDAISRAVALRQKLAVDLLSGFPLQRVVTIGECLLIPLIHLLLLCFLPFPLMRNTRRPSAAAGCGQLFLTTRNAYQKAGGHAAIRQSLHDGIKLPRSYRTRGLNTDLFDASDIATCRMYESGQEVWLGLSKNAHEGFANMPLLLFVTPLMALIFVYPIALLMTAFAALTPLHLFLAFTAMVLGYLPRVICCLRFDRSVIGCLLNPLSIVLFLLIQWQAWINRLRGRKVEWRNRLCETTA